MPAPEKLIIDTPEQIPLEFALAGVGSRFLAIAFDTMLQGLAIGGLLLVAVVTRFFAGAVWPALGPWVLGALILAGFTVYYGYFAVFESIWSGQTPGKRLVALRVIDVSGRPVTVYAALIRNLLRLVDQVPGIYAVGILSVLVTKRNQRIGDLAAGTVVVHERAEAVAHHAAATPTSVRHGADRLEPAEIVLIEGFLRRRQELDPWVRLQTARRIAARMKAKLALGSPQEEEDDERLLEQLAAEYRSADRYR